jgi:RHS repeat-associated protein
MSGTGVEKVLTDYKGGNARMKVQCLANPNYSTHKTTHRNFNMLNIAFKHRSFYRKKREKFTGKELDAETGLYYYGARYLDPKTSRWLSGDPAMGEYFPSAPVSDEARKHNGNLPGQGGVFNYVNLHAYHYAGNNPVKYRDPDGRASSDDNSVIQKPFVRAEANGNNVKYFRDDESGVERSGGTRAWRNNNPGNIRWNSEQIGSAGGFAVFKDYETGFAAIGNLLRSDSYNNLSINDAIARWAPPSENDTANYQSLLTQLTGLDNNRLISSLSADELDSVARAIQIIEGFRAGSETQFSAPSLIIE